MDKVGERIMHLWDAQTTGNDKIYLIFSVNGQKSYCGLAEMVGPWTADKESIEGFRLNSKDMSKQYGYFAPFFMPSTNANYDTGQYR